MGVNPCLDCGACCVAFRVSFHWSEADDAISNGVPVEMTEDLNSTYRAMKGTNQKNPRCVALVGTPGHCVQCRIYPVRPGACRDFEASFSQGVHNERCDFARATIGLPPLTPEDYQDKDLNRPAA